MKKKSYFDFMRVIACALVIFNHLPGYTFYQVSNGWKQFIYMCITMITRINTPIFFMISGALLLGKKETIENVFKKRVVRIALDILVFQFIMFTFNRTIALREGLDFNYTLGEYLRQLLTNSVDGAYAYWYLYSYIGVIIFLPFMQRIANGINQKEIYTIILLHFLNWSALATANLFLEKMGHSPIILTQKLQIPFAFVNCFFFPLVGYYLEWCIDIDKIKKIHILIGGLVTIVAIVLCNIFTYIDATIYGKYSQGYVQMYDYVTAIYAFIVIKYICVKCSNNKIFEITKMAMGFIAPLTLGIYLIDPCLKRTVYLRFEDILEPTLPTIIVSFIWIVISMFIGGTITFILKKIPFVKRLF